jgi:NAD(P)H dehydrogenase (quinone)
LKILLVFCHPRESSLTGEIARSFQTGAVHAGHQIEFVDLYREGFDPILYEHDEPTDGTLESYSVGVQKEFLRINRNDAVVIVFPVWWWSMPAMLKGWIDRVWNYGLTYGPATHNIHKGLMIGLTGATNKDLEKRGYDVAIRTTLPGIFGFNRIPSTQLVIMDGTSEGESHQEKHIEQAFSMGLDF